MIARVLAGIILAFGLLVVGAAAAGYEVRLDLRLDRLDRFHSYAPTSTRPAIGACFFLLGSGLLTIRTKSRIRRVCAHIAVSLVALCATLAVLCALFDRWLFSGREAAGPVSYLAAFAFLVLCAGYYLLETEVSLLTMLAGHTMGGMVARRLLPAAFVVPPAVGWATRLAEQHGLYPAAIGESVEALTNVLVFAALISWTARRIVQADAERQRAVLLMRRSEARYQRVAANVPGMVYQRVLRADGSVVYPFISEGCREVFGYDPAEVQQNPALLMGSVHPEDQRPLRESFAISARTLEPWHWLGRIIRPDTGEVRCIEGTSRPERLASGDVVWDGVIMDVTERKQAEENRRAKEEAERINLAKNRFLSRMSHELRTPLNAILGFGQLLELNQPEGENAQCVDQILKGGRYLLALIDEVLDLSRIEAGELAMKLSPVSLQESARDSLAFVSRLAEARGIACTMEPSPAWQLPVLADDRRLRQVLLNLLSNAIKYNSEGGRVTLLCERSTHARLRLRVRDTGQGISADGLARLFTPFERLGQEAGQVEGTGLGLVVSKRLVETMGGQLGVESELGSGTTFWMDLPLESDPPRGAAGCAVVSGFAMAGTDPDFAQPDILSTARQA